MPAQSTIELGFGNLSDTKQQAAEVTASLKAVLDIAKQLDGFKINISDWNAGIRDFKTNSDAAAKSQAGLADSVNQASKSIIAQSKVREANAKAAKAETDADSAVIKQIGLEADAEKKLAAAKLATAKASQQKTQITAQEVPFTHNLNPNGSVNEPSVGATTGATVSDAELANTEAQLQAQQALNDEKVQSQKINKDEAASIVQLTTASSEYVGSINQNIKALIEDEAALAANKAAQKELIGVMAAGGGATAEQTEQLVALKTEQFQLNKSIADTRANVKGLTAEFVSEEGSINELRSQVTILTAEYEALGAAGKASQQGIDLKAKINSLHPALLQAESELGKFQRNVGNYTGGIQKFFQGAFSQIRTLAQILPGIGIAGLFGVAIDFVTKLVSNLNKGKEAIDSFKKSQEILNTSIESGNGSYAEAVKNIAQLREDIDLARQGFIDKNKVVTLYNETIGKTTGQVHSLDEAEQQLNKNADAYIKFTLYKAAANEAYNEAAKKAVETQVEINKTVGTKDFITQSQQGYEEALKANKEYQAALKQSIEELAKYGAATEATQQKLESVKQSVRDSLISPDTQKDQRALESIGNDFQKKAAEIAKQFHFNFFGDKTTNKKDADEAFKIAQDALQHQIKNLQEFVNETSPVLFQMRFDAAKKEADLEIKLSDLIMQHDIKNGTGRVLAAQQNSERVEDINKRLNKNLEKIIDDRNKILLEEPPPIAPPEEISFEEQIQKQLATQKKVNDDLTRIIEAAGQDRINIIASNAAKEEQVLNEKYAKGLISEEKYQNELAKIQVKKQAEVLAEQIRIALANQAKLDKFKDSNQFDKVTAGISEAEAALAKLGYRFDEATGKLVKFADVSSNLSQLQKHLEFAAEATQGLIDLNEELVTAGYERELNAIQAIEDASNERYSTEIRNIQNSTLSEQDKANKITVLEAEQNAKAKQFDEEKRKIQVKEARVAKIAQEASIIATTASAVIAALAPPPVGLGPVAGIPLAIRTGILGALQLAKVIATPIPQYKYGLHSDKATHIGLYGDVQEIVSKPGQRPFLATEPTVDLLPYGTRIKPVSSDEVNMMLYTSMLKNTAMVLAQSDWLEKKQKKTDQSEAWQVAQFLVRNLSKNKPVVKNYIDIGEQIKFQQWVDKNVKGK